MYLCYTKLTNSGTTRVSGPHSAQLSTNLVPGCFWTSNWSREEVGGGFKSGCWTLESGNGDLAESTDNSITTSYVSWCQREKILHKKTVKWQDCKLPHNCPHPIHSFFQATEGSMSLIVHRVFWLVSNTESWNQRTIEFIWTPRELSGLASCLLVTKSSRIDNLIIFSFY